MLIVIAYAFLLMLNIIINLHTRLTIKAQVYESVYEWERSF